MMKAVKSKQGADLKKARRYRGADLRAKRRRSMEQILIFAMSVLASFVMTTTAFGYAIVIMMVLPLIVPATAGSALATAGSAVVLLWSLLRYVRYLERKKILLPALCSVTAAVLGVVYDLRISAKMYELLLGVLLFALSLWFWKFSARVRLPVNPLTGAAAGIISGLCGALFAVNGPPLVLYYNYASQSKESHMASVQTILLIQTAALCAARTAVGAWPEGMGSYLLPLLTGAALGILPGTLLFSCIDTERFKKVIYAVMCAAGIYFAARAVL